MSDTDNDYREVPITFLNFVQVNNSSRNESAYNVFSAPILLFLIKNGNIIVWICWLINNKINIKKANFEMSQ